MGNFNDEDKAYDEADENVVDVFDDGDLDDDGDDNDEDDLNDDNIDDFECSGMFSNSLDICSYFSCIFLGA